MKAPLKVRKTQCATCPFRVGSPYAYLKGDLTACALTSASRICHSTGSNNAINWRTGKRELLCRGARDEQLRFFHTIGFLRKPTDACWRAKWREMKKGKS